MSANIVLPTLSSWAGNLLTTILESKTQADFDAAFQSTFAAECQFVLNGQQLTRDQYKARLQQDSAAGVGEDSTSVKIEQATQVEIGNQGELSGIVCIFFTSISDSKFLLLGAPSEKQVTSSINLEIQPTEPDPQNDLRVRGYFDPRRATVVNQVIAESTINVSIPTSCVPDSKATATTTEQSPKVELGPEPLKFLKTIFDDVGRHLHFSPKATGVKPETLPGLGAFGAGPVNTKQ